MFEGMVCPNCSCDRIDNLDNSYRDQVMLLCGDCKASFYYDGRSVEFKNRSLTAVEDIIVTAEKLNRAITAHEKQDLMKNFIRRNSEKPMAVEILKQIVLQGK